MKEREVEREDGRRSDVLWLRLSGKLRVKCDEMRLRAK